MKKKLGVAPEELEDAPIC